MSRVEVRTKVYSRIDDVPETLKPGRYLIEGKLVEVYEPVDKETLVRELRKIDKYVETYGEDGWV